MSMNTLNIADFKNEKYCYQTFIRVGDLNYGNHLAHDKLISIIHDARVCFFKEHQLPEINLENTFTITVHSLTINYLSQAYLGDTLIIQMFIEEIKKVSFTIKYKISSKDKVVALCSTTLVCYNNNTHKPDKIPQSLLSIIE